MIYFCIFVLVEVVWSVFFVKNYDDFYVCVLKEVEVLKVEGYYFFELKNEIGNCLGVDQFVQYLVVGKKVVYGLDVVYYFGYLVGGDSVLVDGVIGGWIYGDRCW